MLQRIIILSYLLLAPLFMVSMSLDSNDKHSQQSEKFYHYSYNELYKFVFESMSDMAFVTDEVRDIFAAGFAKKFQDKNITFKNMRREYIFRRNSLGYINDLLFKLGVIKDYYQDDYLVVLLKDPDSFYQMLGQDYWEYRGIFELYEDVIKADYLAQIDKLQLKHIDDMLSTKLSSDQLVELGKFALMSGNQKQFSQIMKRLINGQPQVFMNEGFEMESWHLYAHYYYAKSEPKLSLQYCNKLYDLFKRDITFYPIAKQLDMFSEIMPFLTEITPKENIFAIIVEKIFNHPGYQNVTDPRLITLIYMNLSNAAMQHLNQDYIFDLALELDSFISNQEALSQNYFVQETKYNIFNILLLQGDYYNLDIMLDEIEFSPFLNDKNPLYGRLLQVRLLSNTQNQGKEFDQELVLKLIEYLESAYTSSSPDYIQGQQLLISYYNKYGMDDKVIEILQKLEAVIMSGHDNMAQIEFLMFQREMFKHMPKQLDIADQKIRYFYTHHYIPNKKIRRYIRYLIG